MTTISTPSTSATADDISVTDTPGLETEFPLNWADPADAARAWQRDRFHWPDPVSPLGYSVQKISFEQGMVKAVRGFYVPLEIGLTRVNTYVFLGVPGGAPPDDVPLEALKAAAAKAEAAFSAAMGRMQSLWEDDILPEIHEHLAFWEAFDLPAATLPDLLAHADETISRFTRLIDLHFKAILPAYLAISELDECYRQLLDDGNTGAFDAYKLVQGFPNKTVEVGHALWKLSREALHAPDVLAALKAGAGQPGAVTFEALEATETGRAFATKLRDYLEVYGQRGDKFFDLDKPAWIEEPGPALDTLRAYLTQPDSADPGLATTTLAAEREKALAATRARIAGYPAAARSGFEFLLTAAQAGVVVTEDHGFWIDFRAAYKVRRVLVELGERLAAGQVIDAPEDVFMLTLDEVRESIGALIAGQASPQRRPVVAERRAEMDHFATIRPPDFIGAPAPPRPPVEDPMTRAFGKFWGGPDGGFGATETQSEPGLLQGNPGSPGKVKGVARVIRTLAEADRLHPGEILVTESTTPPWTPLFAVAAGLVSDTGGVLSHTAVVAREYGLPAVVGTGRGTDRIVDGMVIEVDGDAGLVHLPEGA